MTVLGWILWWACVVSCVYSIFYWANKRYADGSHGLLMPSGQIWIWELVAALLVWKLDASPWHLIWLTPVCMIIAVVFGHVLKSFGIIAKRSS